MLAMAVQNPLDIHCMFLLKDNRTKQEQCQGRMSPAVISLSHQDLAPEARRLANSHRRAGPRKERMTGRRCLSVGAPVATQWRNGRGENPETDLCGGCVRGGYGPEYSAGHAAAWRENPWCAVIDYGDGGVTWECNYRTFEECYPNVLAGNKGSCNLNPAGPGPQATTPAASHPRKKHHAQR
jgi:hypothetical protein